MKLIGILFWIFGVLGNPCFGFELAPAGAFKLGYDMVLPVQIEWARVSEYKDLPEANQIAAIDISYASLDVVPMSLPVTLPDQGLVGAKWIAIRLVGSHPSDHHLQGFWQWIDLSKKGNFKTIQMTDSASYPFSFRDYEVRGNLFESFDGSSIKDPIFISGKIRSLYFGFTKGSYQDLKAKGDLPWVNLNGQAIAENQIQPWGDFHDLGYKGQFYRLFAKWIWVPEDLNLVYRLVIFDQMSSDHSIESSVFFVGKESD